MMERRISKEECESALFAMGLKKSLGWDGITVEVFTKLWPELGEIIVLIVNNAFLKGDMEKCILRGLNKPVSK